MEWHIGWRATRHISLYLCNWSFFSSCWWTIPTVKWYHHKVSTNLCLTQWYLISCQILQAHSHLFFVLTILWHTSTFSNRPDSNSAGNSWKPLLQVFWRVHHCHRWNTHLCVLIHHWSHAHAQQKRVPFTELSFCLQFQLLFHLLIVWVGWFGHGWCAVVGCACQRVTDRFSFSFSFSFSYLICD